MNSLLYCSAVGNTISRFAASGELLMVRKVRDDGVCCAFLALATVECGTTKGHRGHGSIPSTGMSVKIFDYIEIDGSGSSP